MVTTSAAAKSVPPPLRQLRERQLREQSSKWSQEALHARRVSQRFSADESHIDSEDVERVSKYILKPADPVSETRPSRKSSVFKHFEQIELRDAHPALHNALEELSFINQNLPLRMLQEPMKPAHGKSPIGAADGTSRSLQLSSMYAGCFGEIVFADDEVETPFGGGAKFACFSDKQDVSTVCRLLVDGWGLPLPSVLISVTGSALGLSLEPRLETQFSKGMENLAKCTNGWVITGGTDSGVMALVGRALKRVEKRMPLIGIAPWGALEERDKLYNTELQAMTISLEPRRSLCPLPPASPHAAHYPTA